MKMNSNNLFGDNSTPGFDEGIIRIETDGGSRGNPGQAAVGVLVNGRGYAERIGVKTNNEAEYQAVIFALGKAKQLAGKAMAKKAKVIVKMDSELVVKQLNHEYKVSDANLQSLFMQVHNLRLDFGKIEFKHVLRAENTRADKLVNQALDS